MTEDPAASAARDQLEAELAAARAELRRWRRRAAGTLDAAWLVLGLAIVLVWSSSGPLGAALTAVGVALAVGSVVAGIADGPGGHTPTEREVRVRAAVAALAVLLVVLRFGR